MRKGFTLIEIAVVVAVLAIFLLILITKGSGVRDVARAQAAAESVKSLQVASENYIAKGRMNYTGISMAALKTASLLPNSFNATAGNPWGGDYSISPNAGDATKVDIGMTSVPNSAGTQLNAYFKNSADSTNYDGTNQEWTGTF